MPAEAIVTIRDRQWVVDLATTPQKLAQGLGGLPYLPPGTGMLFDLGVEQVAVVTTQPMLFPIDIVFISRALVVTEVVPNTPPGQQVTSQGPARYFLEVNAGEAAGVEPGDPVLVQVVTPAQAAPGDVFSQLLNLVVTVSVAGVLFSMVGGFFRAALPGARKEKPVLYGPRGELLAHTRRKEHRPTRDDVRVEVWQERDRLHVGIQEKATGEYLVDWWDDDARAMFDMGFFRAGLPGWLSESDPTLVESVLAYAEDMGILAPRPSLSFYPQVVPRPWPGSLEEAEAAVEAYARRMRAAVESYARKASQAAENYRRVAEKAIDGYRRWVMARWRRVQELPAMPRLPHTRPFPPDSCAHCPLHKAPVTTGSPRLIRQPGRREPPQELEYFADSPDHCCSTVDGTGLRPQLESAFKEAIERARKAYGVPSSSSGRGYRELEGLR
jgi:uncharacterized membrane protein (UPF0127 family)